MKEPTSEMYAELQRAYDHFNKELFSGELSNCLITLQRERRTYGYFSHERFINSDGTRTDEIALNPAYFLAVPLVSIMQTIAHEMAHLWQYQLGNPGRRGYHNKEWAEKMESIGLMPSSTGKPGGKKTGDKVSDYVIENGEFEKSCSRLLTQEYKLTWKDRFPDHAIIKALIEKEKLKGGDGKLPSELAELGIDISETGPNKSNRVKYSCKKCGINAWGKPEIKLICGECEVLMKAN